MIAILYNLALPLVVLISLLEVWLGILVYLNSPKRKANQLFLIFTIFLLIWLNFAFLARYFYFFFEISIQLLRIAFSMPPLFIISLYLFSFYFPKEEERPLSGDIIFFSLGLFLFFISIFTNWIIKDLKLESWGVDFVLGKGKVIYYPGLILLTIFVLFFLAKNYLSSSSYFKTKLRYFFVGLAGFVILNFIFNIYFPFLKGTTKFYQLGDYSVLFLLVFTAQAILKKELFGIKIILTEILIAIIVIFLLWQIFYSPDLKNMIWRSILFLLFLISGSLLRKSLRKEIEQKKELERLNKELEKLNLELEKKVQERTKELREKIKELKKFHKITIGRELKMIQLKEELKKLREKFKKRNIS